MEREVPIRVLLAMDRLGYGGGLHGAGRLLVDWSRALRGRGLDVTTVILRAPDAARSDAYGPITLLQRGRFDPRTIGDFRRLFRERRIQIAHLQGFGSLTFGRIAARTMGIPIVAHIHADHRAETGGYPWFVRAADRALASKTRRCIAVSRTTANFATSVQGFAPSDVQVWHNPVDLSRYAPASQAEREDVRRELGLADDDLVVATVARLHRVKGVDILAEAWPAVVREVPSARLLLVGDGDLRDEVVAALEAGGVRSTVTLTGHREDVARLLHAADVLALPSRSEGMPLAALEALASGLPVVAHAVGGIPEVVLDDDNGILVSARPDSLAEGLVQILTDDPYRERLARRARPSVATLSLDDYAVRLESLYREILAEDEPRRGLASFVDERGTGRPASATDPPPRVANG